MLAESILAIIYQDNIKVTQSDSCFSANLCINLIFLDNDNLIQQIVSKCHQAI